MVNRPSETILRAEMDQLSMTPRQGLSQSCAASSSCQLLARLSMISAVTSGNGASTSRTMGGETFCVVVRGLVTLYPPLFVILLCLMVKWETSVSVVCGLMRRPGLIEKAPSNENCGARMTADIPNVTIH